MQVKFERQSLYDEVWTTPLTKLGKKYGLSDNGIRKICKALNIPLPKAGHWAKIAAGHQIKKPTLPKYSGKTEFVSSPKPKEVITPEVEQERQWLSERVEFESIPANRIKVDPNPAKYHRLLIEANRHIKTKIKEYDQLKARAEKERSKVPGRKWEPRMNSMEWESFIRNGQLIEMPSSGLPLRITAGTSNRALIILNAVLLNAEIRGFKLVKTEGSKGLGLKLMEQTVYIRVTEKLKDEIKVIENPSPVQKLLGDDRVKVPTGILRIYTSLSIGYGEICITDTDDQVLENKLNDLFLRVYKQIINGRKQDRVSAERNRQYAESQRLREEQERLKFEESKRLEVESQLRASLLKEATNWQSAHLILSYIEHLDSKAGLTDSLNYLHWKDWATKVASDLDPTLERVESFRFPK